MNQIWSMDFVADALFDGRKLRALSVVDNFTRESLAIDVAQSLKGEDVVRVLNHIVAWRGLPGTIKMDNVLNAIGSDKKVTASPGGEISLVAHLKERVLQHS